MLMLIFEQLQILLQQAKLEEGLAEWKIMKEENQKMEEEIILEP